MDIYGCLAKDQKTRGHPAKPSALPEVSRGVLGDSTSTPGDLPAITYTHTISKIVLACGVTQIENLHLPKKQGRSF